MRRRWWYVTRRSLETTIPTYCRVLLIGPFATRKEAAPYCLAARRAAGEGHAIGGYSGHESVGIERMETARPGHWNAAFRLPVEAPEGTPPAAAAEVAASRLSRLPVAVQGFEVFDGAETDCLALAGARGWPPLGGKQTSRAVAGSYPDQFGTRGEAAWYDLGPGGHIHQHGPLWRLVFTPAHFWGREFAGPGDKVQGAGT